MKWITSLVGLLASMASSTAAEYEYIIIRQGGGQEFTVPEDINNRGEVVFWSLANAQVASFIYRDGTIVNLGSFGGDTTYVVGINNRGQAIGNSDRPPFYGIGRAFLYSHETIQDISSSPDAFTFASCINDKGDIAGKEGEIAFLYRNGQRQDLGRFLPMNMNNRGQIVGINDTDFTGTLYDNGMWIELKAPTGEALHPYAINERGEIVGFISRGYGWTQSFLYRDGAVIDLGMVSSSFPVSRAFNLNNKGSVVGYAHSRGPGPQQNLRAFLYEDGRMFDLNDLIPKNSGIVLETARAINDRGDIVASGHTGDGNTYAFLLRPTRRNSP